jgi:two-component system, response regulator YesN
MSTTQNYKYIVVEDERLIQKNIIKKIEFLSLPLTLVGSATNGMDAQLLIERVCPDLVITDINMPQYNGLELSHYLIKNHPTIKTIIITGYSDFSFAQSALKYGVKDYLLKPISVESLNTCLQKILITMSSEHNELATISNDTNHLDQKTIYELVEQFLCDNYKQDISLGEMANHFGFSIEYLGKIFKKYTKQTPSKYLAKLRINEAKRLLNSQPELEIQKIAEMVGYKDNFYFSRTFKSQVGVPPSDYRIQGMGGDNTR